MRGIVLSLGSVALYAVVFAGLFYGAVWFFSTPYADALRSIGLPVPYCTSHPLASLCEMGYVDPSTVDISSPEELVIFLASRPDGDVLNTVCAVSEEGKNVRAVLAESLKEDSELLIALDACKVKYRFSPGVATNELSTGSCYLSFTGARGVYTCCDAVVDAFNRYFEEVWKSASP